MMVASATLRRVRSVSLQLQLPRLGVRLTPAAARTQARAGYANDTGFDHAAAALSVPGKRANNPRKVFVAQRVSEVVEQPLLGIVRHDALTAREWIDVRADWGEKGLRVTVLPNKIVRAVLRDTEHAHVAALFRGPSAAVHAPDTSLLKVLMKGTKEHPKLVSMHPSCGAWIPLMFRGLESCAGPSSFRACASCAPSGLPLPHSHAQTHLPTQTR